jgi:sphinganine-1-phosphate aldolase
MIKLEIVGENIYDRVLKYLGYAFIGKLSYDFINYATPIIYKKVKKIPVIEKQINIKKDKTIAQIKKELNKEIEGNKLYLELPQDGMKEDEILTIFNKLKTLQSYDYKNGRVSGTIYTNNDELDKFMNKIFLTFYRTNPLHSDIFPAVRKMESEVISMMIKMFNGGQDTCGTFTNGGTESILLACKAYQQWGRSEGIRKPEIIVSSTAHASYKKACYYFRMKYIEIPALPDGKVDLNAMKRKINSNTVMIVGSTPCYNFGTIDQIEELAQIAKENKIGLHVDACLGAFLINFMNLNLDFQIDGVTSISADLHKFGNTPKGASVIMYHNKELMKFQYFIDDKWTGGIYATPTLAGSRDGNIISLTWATLMKTGLNGYQENFYRIIEIKEYLLIKLKEIKEIFIFGDPKLSVIAVGSEEFDINLLSSKLKDKKWNLNMIQNPKGFHICLTNCHTRKIIDQLIIDIKSVIKDIDTNFKDEKSMCIYGTAQEISDKDIIREVVSEYLYTLNKIE